MPDASVNAAAAPNAAAPTKASASDPARLNTATTSPMAATPSRVSRDGIVPAPHLERGEPADRADAEQRDEHAELGVGRVEHLAHEHDAEREQRAQPQRHRRGCRHDRANQRDAERLAEPHRLVGRPARRPAGAAS